MVPADEFSAKSLIKQAATHPGPVYVRTGRSKAPIIYNAETKFEIGKGIKLRDGKDVTLIGTGLLVFEALEAAEILKQKGIEASVIDIHTLKPLDRELLLAQAKATKAFVVAEEHLVFGGLGSAVSQLISQEFPIPVEFVGIEDTYAESGNPDDLLKKYGLTSQHIAQAAEKAVARKSK
jgi:transketolase